METEDRRGSVYGVASVLRIDAATREIMKAFAESDLHAIVLKGPAIAGWLYSADEPRYYLDSDLLVCPAHTGPAEEVLTRLGFVKRFDDSRMPDWWHEHATEWRRSADGVLVDVHRRLPGVGIDDEGAWALLSEGTEPVRLAGGTVPALGLPARVLHVAIHAAHHGAAWEGRPMADLERAVVRVSEETWVRASALAGRLQATDSLAAGLRLDPRGRELADRLALPPVQSVDIALHSLSPPPGALAIEQVLRAESGGRRLAITWRKLFPPVDFVRHWQPIGTDTRRGLALAYLRRPLWVMRNLPRGVQAWWRAARHVRRGHD